MKKLLLAAIGLTGLLASCDTGTALDTTPPNITSASNLITNHRLSAVATDVSTGITYPIGTYVICNNKDTAIQLDVAWTGAMYDLDVYATGGYYGADKYKYLGSAKLGGATNTSQTITYTFGQNAAPLSVNAGLTAQGITVNPVVSINVKGQTSITVQGNSRLDNPGNYVRATTLNTVPNNYQLPVVDCQ